MIWKSYPAFDPRASLFQEVRRPLFCGFTYAAVANDGVPKLIADASSTSTYAFEEAETSMMGPRSESTAHYLLLFSVPSFRYGAESLSVVHVFTRYAQ